MGPHQRNLPTFLLDSSWKTAFCWSPTPQTATTLLLLHPSDPHHIYAKEIPSLRPFAPLSCEESFPVLCNSANLWGGTTPKHLSFLAKTQAPHPTPLPLPHMAPFLSEKPRTIFLLPQNALSIKEIFSSHCYEATTCSFSLHLVLSLNLQAFTLSTSLHPFQKHGETLS